MNEIILAIFESEINGEITSDTRNQLIDIINEAGITQRKSRYAIQIEDFKNQLERLEKAHRQKLAKLNAEYESDKQIILNNIKKARNTMAAYT